MSRSILYCNKFVNFNSGLVVQVFLIEMLDKLMTYIVCRYKTLYQVSSVVMTHNDTSHLIKTLNTKKTITYDVGNQGPGLGQAHICGKVKPVNGIPTLPSS